MVVPVLPKRATGRLWTRRRVVPGVRPIRAWRVMSGDDNGMRLIRRLGRSIWSAERVHLCSKSINFACHICVGHLQLGDIIDSWGEKKKRAPGSITKKRSAKAMNWSHGGSHASSSKKARGRTINLPHLGNIGSAFNGKCLVLTFGQDLPFAGLHASVGWELVSKLIEQILHFLSPLALGHLVRDAQLGRARVGRFFL